MYDLPTHPDGNFYSIPEVNDLLKNITPDNIGAVPKTGGNFTGDVTINNDKVALEKNYLFSKAIAMSGGKSYAINIPENYKGVIFTVPLTSSLDGWSLFGIRAQTGTNYYKYYKTLISSTGVTITQTGGATKDLVINNLLQYITVALIIGSDIVTFTEQE